MLSVGSDGDVIVLQRENVDLVYALDAAKVDLRPVRKRVERSIIPHAASARVRAFAVPLFIAEAGYPAS